MKKARLFLLLGLIGILALSVLVGCKKSDAISSVYLKDHDPESMIETSVGVFDYGAYTLVVDRSGSLEEITLTEEMIEEADLVKFYQEGVHDITVLYGKYKYDFKISVKRSTFGELYFPENTVFTYDGKPHKIEVQGNIPANAVVTYPAGNSFTNAGTYSVVATVSCDGYVSASLSTTVTIERAKYDMSGVKFDAKEFVYDGASHSVAISGTLPAGVSSPTYVINEKITSSATEVGDYEVVAKFTVNNPNYEPIPDMVTTLKITPAEYVVGGIDLVFKNGDGTVIGDRVKVYDGSVVTFDLSDYNKLWNKVSVTFCVYDENGELLSESNKKTNILNAGVYTVKAVFTLADSKNYKPIEPIVRSFEILKADYPAIDGVTLDSRQTTYDGTEQFIRINGLLPEDVTVSYEYYLNGALVVDAEGKPLQAVKNAGRYTVMAIFTHNDTNKNPIPTLTAILNVDKMKTDISLVGFSCDSSMEYSGEPFEPEFFTWKDLYNTSFDILDYGPVKYYVYDDDLGEYVKMGEGERPTEVGLYKFFITVSIADEYLKNYIFKNGEVSADIVTKFEIKKQKIELPAVSFSGETSTVYSGNASKVEFESNADSESMTVSFGYYRYTTDGYVALENGELPVNAGTYKFTVFIALNDAERYIFANGESVEEYSFEFEITKLVIDLDEIFVQNTEYEYSGKDLREKIFEDLDPEIRKYLGYTVMRMDENLYGDWYEIYGISSRGNYRIQYYVYAKDMSNVSLISYGNECTSTYMFYLFSIV